MSSSTKRQLVPYFGHITCGMDWWVVSIYLMNGGAKPCKGVTEIKNPIGGHIRNFSLVWDPPLPPSFLIWQPRDVIRLDMFPI